MMEKVKKSMSVVFLIIIAFTAVSASGAWADSAAYKNYGRLTIGVNQPKGDLDDAGYDAGFNIGATYGRYLGKNLVVEGSLGSFFTDQDFSGRTALAGNYTREDFVSASFILGTIKGELPLGPVTLYAGAGVGFYFVTLDSEIDTTTLGDLDAYDSDSAFGTHVVAGGYFNITPRVFVGVEGLYRWTTEFDMKETVGTVPVEVEGDLNGYTICLTGGFSF
ncbi:MAG: outer membrane beta-barrel protein [Thermodesulfovibrionia bacterium]|nr:outer membrane beta-barrel protein [Thermodesulfovibrionia bacterium]